MEDEPFKITSFEWDKEIKARLAAAGEEFDSDGLTLGPVKVK